MSMEKMPDMNSGQIDERPEDPIETEKTEGPKNKEEATERLKEINEELKALREAEPKGATQEQKNLSDWPSLAQNIEKNVKRYEELKEEARRLRDEFYIY